MCAGRNGACSPPAARHKLRAVGRGATRTSCGARRSTTSSHAGLAALSPGASSVKTYLMKKIVSSSTRLGPDDTGMPGVTIHYRTGENSRRMLKFMAAKARESLVEAGAYRTVTAPQSRESGWHILGTAKMGIDPKNSVVDRYGRSHDVANLFIVDGSVWPTSAGVNPTATIAAFASWSAAHVIANRASQRMAS